MMRAKQSDVFNTRPLGCKTAAGMMPPSSGAGALMEHMNLSLKFTIIGGAGPEKCDDSATF
jgi:hypothetical protein